MPELDPYQLEAAARVALSGWQTWQNNAPLSQRKHLHSRYAMQLRTKYYRGIPGFPRSADGRITPTDFNAGQVFSTVFMRHLATDGQQL